MPTLYLVDNHSTVLSTSKINDTVNVPSGNVETRSIRGSFPVVVPFDIPVDGTPSDLDDLIAKKFTAMLSLYPGYTNILFDEQTDTNGWVAPGPSVRGYSVGNRQSTYMLANQASYLTSTTNVLSATPSVGILRWDAFELLYSDVTGSANARLYREAPPTAWNVFVSFNGGSTEFQVTQGVPFNISLVNQGSSFRVRFNRNGINTPAKAWLGSWALIY